MSDTPTQELIDSLRRSVRRWKTVALTLLVGVGLLIVLGTTMTVVQVQRARQREKFARQAVTEALREAEASQRNEEEASRMMLETIGKAEQALQGNERKN